MPFKCWFNIFLEEKGLLDTTQSWEIQDALGNIHFINSEVVIEAIKNFPSHMQRDVKAMLVKIDFTNGNVMDYFKYLAKHIVNM